MPHLRLQRVRLSPFRLLTAGGGIVTAGFRWTPAACLLLSYSLLPLSAQGTSRAPADPGPRASEKAGLDFFLRSAEEHHPDLRAAESRWRAALQERNLRRSLPDPRLSVSWGGMNRGPGVAIMQEIPLWTKRRLEGAMADSMALAAQRWVEAARWAIFAGVADAYARYAFSLEARVSTRENLTLLRELEAVLLAGYRTGDIPFADLVRLQLERSRVEDELRSWEERVPTEAALLNAAVGLPIRSPLPEVEPLRPVEMNWDDDELLAEVSRSNPELAAVLAEGAAARVGRERARQDYWPDLGLGLEYLGPGQMSRGGLGLMVEFGLPTWRKRLAAGLAQAEAHERAAVASAEEVRRRVEAEARSALFRFHDARRKALLFEGELLPQARQALEATRTAYRTGQAGYSDLVESLRTVWQFRLALAEALADQVRTVAELEGYVGRRLRPPPGEEEVRLWRRP